LEILDSLPEKWFSLVLLGGWLWAFFRLHRLEVRLDRLSLQQTNFAEFRASLDGELSAIKSDISWLSEDCFKTPRPVKL
jgi:hypothetical protein